MGPAGSGKTSRLLESFEQSLKENTAPLDDNLFFLVPSLEHTDRMISLLLQKGVRGFFNRRVTTLSELFKRFAGVTEAEVVSNVARYLLFKDILQESSLDYFQSIQKSSGFTNLMQSFVLELKESLIAPDRFRDRLNQLKAMEPDLASKYEALASLYEIYQEALEKKGLEDSQDAWLRLSGREESLSFPPGGFKKIWMDGFFDFSKLQRQSLAVLCRHTEEITVSLTLDPDEARYSLFEIVHKTKDYLLQMGFEPVYLKRSKPKRTSVLYHIEENLFLPAVRAKKTKPGSEIAVFEAVGLEGEVEMIARTISHMLHKGGYRLSDFAVLFRQIGEYADVIRSVFARYDLPFEIHEREKLNFSAAIQTLRCFLHIFTQGWRRQDVINFLKSSYLLRIDGEEKEPEWIHALEHESMRKGVFVGRPQWEKAWTDCQDKTLPPVQEKIMKCLGRFEDHLRQADSFESLKQIFLRQILDFGIFQYRKSGEASEKRDGAAFRRLLAILDEIGYSLETRRLEKEKLFDSFAERFDRLTQLDLYSLPERDKNKVQIYDISLARQKEYSVVFLAGLLERKFPVQIKEDPVLSDWERRLLNGLSQDEFLEERLPRQALERYLFYLALTRARQKIILTYPKFDLEGKEALPSFYLQDVLNLFQGELTFKRQELSAPFPAFEEAVNFRELELSLAGHLQLQPERCSAADKKLFGDLFERLLARPESRFRFKRAIYEIRAGLSDSRIRRRGAFRSEHTSPTALEEYASCPFRYFSDRVLHLKDPEMDPNITTRGSILHRVLELCFESWKPTPDIFTDKDKAFMQALKILEDVLPEFPLLTEKKYQYDLEIESMKEMLLRFLDAELNRLNHSILKPAYLEYAFGFENTDPPLEIRDGDRVIKIRGKIDRIDIDPEKKAALVTDYKRTASFKRGDLEFGTALQLPLYSLIVERNLKLRSVGAELYSIRDRKANGFYREDAGTYLPKLSSRKMILAEKDYDSLLSKAENFVKRFTREMDAMEIPVRPRDCVQFCPYGSVCRIEKWKLPLILEEIREEDARREKTQNV